jgi:hypothetical protein
VRFLDTICITVYLDAPTVGRRVVCLFFRPLLAGILVNKGYGNDSVSCRAPHDIDHAEVRIMRMHIYQVQSDYHS